MEMETKKSKSEGLMHMIEIAGNKIPDPLVFFLILIVACLVGSFIMSYFGISDINPATGKTVKAYNLLSKDGFIRMLTSVISNFQGFTVMCMTLTCMFGMCVADQSRFFESIMKHVILSSKGSDKKIIMIFCLISALADITNGGGFVIMPLLGGIVWGNMGRNPIAGMLCGYGTIAGAFCANFMLGTTGIVCAGFTQNAARVIDPSYVATASMGWYYQSVAAILLTLTSYFVTTRYVEPRLGKYQGEYIARQEEKLPNEGKALKFAVIALFIYVILIVINAVPAGAILRDPKTGNLVSGKSPFMQSLVFLISMFFFIPGLVFGKVTGTIPNIKRLIKVLNSGIAAMSGFIVLSFVMAQFMKYFAWSNMGTIIAIKGAKGLAASGLPFIGICVVFILFCGVLNLFMGSASAKYGLIAPVFVPMFMLMGYDPSVAQMCYRIGDAITNPITPTFAYIAMLMEAVKKYDPQMGFGSLIAGLMPYTISFTIVMICEFVIWLLLGMPLGPGGSIFFGG